MKKAGKIITILTLTLCGLWLQGCREDVLKYAREALPEQDGWASEDGGTQGGGSAEEQNIYIVSDRGSLVKALDVEGRRETPKIILIKGTVNLSTDDDNNELFEKDYADQEYNFNDYVEAYKPSKWNVALEANGRPARTLTGILEEARQRSAERQKERVVINIPSNTSIIGIGKDSKIIKGNLMIREGVENVIIRNITFEDAFDYFPAWDPGDSFKLDTSYPGAAKEYVDEKTGPQMAPGGRWNSEYDLISIKGGKRVWIDHCTFNDGERPDTLFPPVFPFPHNQVEQKVQHHDGLVDITDGADLVTVSYCVFMDHDKTALIGSSDKSTTDPGKLNVTFHHNLFKNSGQRLPRVRFGKVHSYNNLFMGNAAGAPDPGLNAFENHLAAVNLAPKHNIFRGAFGIGKESAIYSENNYFMIENGGPEFTAVIQGGTRFYDSGSMVNGKAEDIVAAINAMDEKKQVSPEAGWKPVLYGTAPLLSAVEVPEFVKKNAGAGKIEIKPNR